MRLKVLVVDDEPLAREGLKLLVGRQPGVESVSEARNGREAIAIIRERLPDLVLLDVQMPRMDGFAVVHAVGPERMPAVIFVTAHDQYAVRAFEVHAFDYLLKPVDQDRLREAMGWALATRRGPQGSSTRRVLALLEELNARDRARGRDRLVVRTPERAIFLRTETIDWIEAAGKFVHLHVGRTTHALRESMAELEQELDSARFLRISRSAIVNLERIQEVQPWFQGDYVLILADGTRLTSTRGYRENMRRLLGRSA